MNRPGIPLRTRMRLPRFRAKNFSTCTRSPTARGSSHASHSPQDDVAFSSTERDRHLGIRPVSQLNTWPVVSPVNASRRPSRATPRITRGRGGWLDLPRGGLSPPILCQLPGALRTGSFTSFRACASDFCSVPLRTYRRTPANDVQGQLRRMRAPYLYLCLPRSAQLSQTVSGKLLRRKYTRRTLGQI